LSDSTSVRIVRLPWWGHVFKYKLNISCAFFPCIFYEQENLYPIHSSFFLCKLYKEYLNYENIQYHSSRWIIMKLIHKSLHENLRKTSISLKEESWWYSGLWPIQFSIFSSKPNRSVTSEQGSTQRFWQFMESLICSSLTITSMYR